MENTNNRSLSLKLSHQGTSSLSSGGSINVLKTLWTILWLLSSLFSYYFNSVQHFMKEPYANILCCSGRLASYFPVLCWTFCCNPTASTQHFSRTLTIPTVPPALPCLQQALVPRIPATTLWNCILMSWRNGSESGRVAFTVCPSPHPPPHHNNNPTTSRSRSWACRSGWIHKSSPFGSRTPLSRVKRFSASARVFHKLLYRNHDKT